MTERHHDEDDPADDQAQSDEHEREGAEDSQHDRSEDCRADVEDALSGEARDVDCVRACCGCVEVGDALSHGRADFAGAGHAAMERDGVAGCVMGDGDVHSAGEVGAARVEGAVECAADLV